VNRKADFLQFKMNRWIDSNRESECTINQSINQSINQCVYFKNERSSSSPRDWKFWQIFNNVNKSSSASRLHLRGIKQTVRWSELPVVK